MASNAQKMLETLKSLPSTAQRLKRQDFDLTNGVSGTRSKIASFTAKSPIAFRAGAVRLMFATVEEFETDGNGGDQETFNLSHNLISSANTTDFVLFENGSRVAADSVDYAANSFKYTDDGTNNYLHACYVARDPVEIEIQKTAPKAMGKVEEVIYDDATSILHERNQNKEPPELDFSSRTPLTPVVPRKWSIDIYQNGPVSFEWNDDAEANSQGVVATNPVVSLPINRAKSDVQGLAQAVKEDIIS